MPVVYRPAIFDKIQNTIAAESTRHGGVSPFPYHSLNAGYYTDDDPRNIRENRDRLFATLGISESQVASSHQVHGDQILLAEAPGCYEGYDALMTNCPGVFVAVTIADCTPILVCDPVNRAVAAIHAGWKGTAARIVEKTVEAMSHHFSTAPGDCLAYVGTCIDECSYEVGEEVGKQFDTPFARFDRASGKYCVDLKAANAAQLEGAGILRENIEISPFSTVLHNEDYFSHRKEKGVTGRMTAVIGLGIS
jgi:YfiH family protein